MMRDTAAQAADLGNPLRLTRQCSKYEILHVSHFLYIIKWAATPPIFSVFHHRSVPQ
jgi:hypothetical protein